VDAARVEAAPAPEAVINALRDPLVGSAAGIAGMIDTAALVGEHDRQGGVEAGAPRFDIRLDGNGSG
jgi:hypothetical protein